MLLTIPLSLRGSLLIVQLIIKRLTRFPKECQLLPLLGTRMLEIGFYDFQHPGSPMMYRHHPLQSYGAI